MRCSAALLLCYVWNAFAAPALTDWPKPLSNPFIVQVKGSRPSLHHQVVLRSHIISIDSEYLRDLGVTFGVMHVPIFKFGKDIQLDAKITALERAGHARVIATPEVVTIDRHTALIESGEEVPYQQETVGGATNIAFKKAVLRLEVTPTLLSSKQLQLKLKINQDKVSALTVKGVPAIHTQQLTTEVELRNQQTCVLGGIYESHHSNLIEGVPFLRRIPFIGVLFRKHRDLNTHRELLVFITPEIL